MAAALGAIGARVEEVEDGMIVHGTGGAPLPGGATIAIRKDLRVPMRDGIELAADAYQGTDEKPRPALVALSPYGKELQALALTTPPQRRPSPMWDGCIEAGDIARLLYPQAEDLTILKPRHSAFFASPLDLLLSEMGATELVICGLATDMCVQMTAADAFLREYKTWVPADCTAAQDEAAEAAALAYIARVFKCEVHPAGNG